MGTADTQQRPPDRRANAGGQATRERLIDVAERLFAERGIGAVSLREIADAAGQRNTGAPQYHFGDKDGLVVAIIERRLQDLDQRRAGLLVGQPHGDRAMELRSLAEALVIPHADQLRAGYRFAGFYARLLLDFPASAYAESRHPQELSTWRALGARLSAARPELDSEAVRWRLEFAATSTLLALERYFANTGEQSAAAAAQLAEGERRLIGSIAAILAGVDY